MGLVVFLQSVFAPGLAATLTVLLLAWRTDPVGPLARRSGAGAWIAGVFAGYWASFGLPWPVESSVDWPIWAGVGAWLLANFIPPASEADRKRQLSLAVLIAAGVAGYSLPMTQPLVPRFWETGDQYLVVAAAGLSAGVFVWCSLRAVEKFSPARYLPSIVTWLGLASGLLMASGSARAAQTAGIGAAAAGALMLFSWLRPDGMWHRRVAVPVIGLLAVLAVQHYGFGDEVGAWPLFMLGVPGLPHRIWARFAKPERAGWVDALVLCILSALPLAWGWIAYAMNASDDPYGGYGSGYRS